MIIKAKRGGPCHGEEKCNRTIKVGSTIYLDEGQAMCFYCAVQLGLVKQPKNWYVSPDN